jgi:hypothetical protein
MPTEDEMTLDERRKYLKRMKPRYMKAKRGERSALLSEMEQVTGMHRKSLTRLLHAASLDRKRRKAPRKRSYGAEVEEVIVQVWESLDYICAERLTPVLLPMAQHLARFATVKLSGEIEEQLQTISRSTVSRLLRRFRSRRRRLPQKGAERANQVTKGVPMGRLAWDLKEPGQGAGGSGVSQWREHGRRAWAYHPDEMVDVATGWSERVAVMGRGQRAMEAGFERLLSRLPFAVVELHPDNGSEFFNYHLVHYWKEKVVGVQLSRSRPYQKNDNRIVDQKNDTLVRQYFGDLRFDRPEQIEAMNALYEQMWLYYNLFQPVMHLIEKTAVGDKVRRKWDQARTPFERLKATGKLSAQQEQRLQTLYEQTSPHHLREEIYQCLAQLWSQSMASATEVA